MPEWVLLMTERWTLLSRSTIPWAASKIAWPADPNMVWYKMHSCKSSFLLVLMRSNNEVMKNEGAKDLVI